MPDRPYTEVPYVSPDDEVEDPPPGATHHSAERHIEHHHHEEEHEPERPRGGLIGNGMGKRIVGILVAVIVVYLIWMGWQRYRASVTSDNGAVQNADTGEAVRPTPSRSDDGGSSFNEQHPAAAAPARQPVVTQSGFNTTTPAYNTAAAPATDSISPNPPNGMAFTGTGKFQVYRQGNLTWRINTESGSACVLFATMEEWRKPLVYQHGCA